MLELELKPIKDYQKETGLNIQDICNKLLNGELEAFVSLRDITGIVLRDYAGAIQSYLIDMQDWEGFPNSHNDAHLPDIIKKFGKCHSYTVNVSGLCKLGMDCIYNEMAEIIKGDKILLKYNMRLRKGQYTVYDSASPQLKLTKSYVDDAEKGLIFIPKPKGKSQYELHQLKSGNNYAGCYVSTDCDCFVIQSNEILIREKKSRAFSVYLMSECGKMLSEGDVSIKEIVELFWARQEHKKIYRFIETSIKSGELALKNGNETNANNAFLVDPEIFVRWAIEKNFLPEPAYKFGLLRYLKYIVEYEKIILDTREYCKLSVEEADRIFQLAEQGKIDVFVKMKNQSKTLKIFHIDKDEQLKYLDKELDGRRDAYKKVIKKKTYWKLNNYDYLGNYITQLNQDHKISSNFIHFEQTDIEKGLGISCWQRRTITLDDVFVLKDDIVRLGLDKALPVNADNKESTDRNQEQNNKPIVKVKSQQKRTNAFMEFIKEEFKVLSNDGAKYVSAQEAWSHLNSLLNKDFHPVLVDIGVFSNSDARIVYKSSTSKECSFGKGRFANIISELNNPK